MTRLPRARLPISQTLQSVRCSPVRNGQARELLMMVINDDREALPEVGPRVDRDAKDVLSSPDGFFLEPRYSILGERARTLATSPAVQQTIDYNLVRDPGPELARFDAGRQVLIKHLRHVF